MIQLLRKLDSWVRNNTQRILGFIEDRLAPFTLMVLVSVPQVGAMRSDFET